MRDTSKCGSRPGDSSPSDPNCVKGGDGSAGSGTRMLRNVTVYAAIKCVAAESSGHGSVHGSTTWALHPVVAEREDNGSA